MGSRTLSRVDLPRAERAFAELLRALGVSAEQEPELQGTPERAARALGLDLLGGYGVDVQARLAGDGGAAPDGELVVLKELAVVTVCPHHLLPAMGTATVAYDPGPRVHGLGAVAEVVDGLARRLTLQERLGQRVVEVLMDAGAARGAFCRLELRHACLSGRGARQHAARVVTVAREGTLAGEAGERRLLLALGGDRP